MQTVWLSSWSKRRKTKSGIILTAPPKRKPEVAEVIEVSPGGVVDGKEITMTVKKGSKVITSKYSGTEVKVDGEGVHYRPSGRHSGDRRITQRNGEISRPPAEGPA